MQEKNKYENDHFSDFLRYRGNEMTDKERNAFEKSLQKDLFAEEASEGIMGTDPVQAEKDISELRKQLNRRTSARRRMLWYRIAASFAAVMILSFLFIFEGREKPSVPTVRNLISPAATERPDLSQTRPDNAGIKDQIPVVSDNRQKVRSEMKKSESVSAQKEEYGVVEIQNGDQVAITVAEAKEPEQAVVIERTNALMTAGAERVSARYVPVRGKIISSEDNQPIPGASIIIKGTEKGTFTDTGGNFILDAQEAVDRMLVAHFVGMESKEFKAVEDSNLEIKLDPSVTALNETVVIGYGVKERGKEQKDALKGYIPPQPVNGKADFDKYIRDHIKRPDTLTTGQRVVVVLSFIVEKTGETDHIKVVRSPGRIFSDEAIRLIREGPSWNPARENGETISDEVRIRIVFR